MKVLKVIALVWTAISILFVGFALLASVIDVFQGVDNTGFSSFTELLSFIFFPISVFIGLGISFKYRGAGGLVTILALVGFYFTRPDLILDPMITSIAFPGFIHLLYWYLARRA